MRVDASSSKGARASAAREVYSDSRTRVALLTLGAATAEEEELPAVQACIMAELQAVGGRQAVTAWGEGS